MDAKVDIVINLTVFFWKDAMCCNEMGLPGKTINCTFKPSSVKPHTMILNFYYRKKCDVMSRGKAL